MALQVKNSILQREQTILVAIDVAERKMEMLSMISTLCHHFSAPRSSRNCWLKKLSNILGRKAVEILEQLVSCQKKYNRLKGYTVPMTGFQGQGSNMVALTRAEMRTAVVLRLKESPAKQKFLKEIVKKGKSLLTLNTGVGRRAITDGSSITDPTTNFSVVGLLQAALKSKYRQHVIRCFKDLDVESLMNILFLMMPSSPASEQSATNNFMLSSPEMSSFSSVMEENSFEKLVDLNQSAASPLISQGSWHSLFWDDEKTVINFIQEQEESTSYSPHHIKLAEPFQKQQWDETIMRALQVQEKFRNIFFSNASSFLSDTSCTQLHSDYFMDLEMVELYEEFSRFISANNLEAITGLLNEKTEDDSYRDAPKLQEDKTNDICQNFSHTFLLFRSMVSSMFERSRSPEGHGLQGFNRMTIDLKLLSIEEDKFNKILMRTMAKQRDQHERLDGSVLEWRNEVEDMRRRMSEEIRNSIKNHVAAEISIAKSREKELASYKKELGVQRGSMSQTEYFVRQSVKSLRARRHYLEASLESIIREYNSTMLKYQAKIDELSVEEVANNRAIEGLQNKFKDIEEKYDEMRAMKRLKQLLQNMQKAEAIKQNWAARKIQVAWRKYKVAKLRKKKLKGRKRGKKKTPPPGKGTSPPTKSSTPGSRSKSQTP